MKVTFAFILLISLISPIILIAQNDIEEITFDGEYFSRLFVEKEPKYFKIVFQTEKIKNYLKIEVDNINKKEDPTFFLAFSDNDETCLDREQLSQGKNIIQMWLTKSQVENNNNYLYLSCTSSSCNFELKLSGTDIFSIDYNSQINLYVTDKNKNVEIDIESTSSPSEEYDFITIWAIGNKNVIADISDVEYQKYSKNNIFKIKTSTINKSIYLLNITGEEWDVINIGSSTTSVKGYNNLAINQPEVKGYLVKDFSTQDCYQLPKDTNSSIIYLSGIIHTKIAQIYYKKWLFYSYFKA